MRILVAGATGVVGSYLVPQLVERGHEVFGTTTTPRKLAEIAAAGATPMLLDALDGTAVRRVVEQARPEAIVHQMTALKGRPDFKRFDRWFATTNELRTTGTRHLLEAARATGSVRKFVAQSYVGWTHEVADGRPITEDEPFDTQPLAQQRRTLEAIRRMEQQVLDAPLEGVVLRYANLYSAASMADSIELLKSRRFPIVGSGAGVWSWLHASDAAGAAVQALERPARGVFNVADDDPAPVAEWLPHLAQVVGAPRPMRVPAWLAKLVIGAAGVRMMTRVRGVSNARIKRELGWRPAQATWREGFKSIARAEATKEMAHALS